MSEIPNALKKAGFTKLTSNRRDDQEVVIKDGLIGLFFGEELAERLLAKQKKDQIRHG